MLRNTVESGQASAKTVEYLLANVADTSHAADTGSALHSRSKSGMNSGSTMQYVATPSVTTTASVPPRCVICLLMMTDNDIYLLLISEYSNVS